MGWGASMPRTGNLEFFKVPFNNEPFAKIVIPVKTGIQKAHN